MEILVTLDQTLFHSEERADETKGLKERERWDTVGEHRFIHADAALISIDTFCLLLSTSEGR